MDEVKVKKRGAEKSAPALIDNLRLCEMLGVLPDTWRKRVSRGVSPLPFTVMGARTYYRVSDVRHFLKNGTWPARMRFRGLDPGVPAPAESTLEDRSPLPPG